MLTLEPAVVLRGPSLSSLSATSAAKEDRKRMSSSSSSSSGIKMRQVKLITSQMRRKKRATAVQMWDHVEDRASRRDLANKQIYQIKKKILRAEQNSDLVQLYAALPETGNAAVYATGNVDFRHGMLAFGNIVAFLQDNGGKVNKKLNFCVKDAWDEVTGADGIELIRHLRTTLLRIGLEGDLLDRLDAALQRGLVRGGGSELKRVVALHLTPALKGLSAAIEALEGDQMLSTITGSDTEMDEDEDSSSDETGNGEEEDDDDDDGNDGNDGNDDEMTQVGQYQAEDSATLMANLSSLNTSVLAWFDLDISTDEKVRALMAIDDAERSRLEGISQDDAAGSGGKNADWLCARAPNGICRQTGSAIDRARRKQPSHLKSQVGVAPDGTEVKAWGATASMQYGTDHEKDGFAGVRAFFDDWFKTTYCVQYGTEYSECEIAYEGDMGIFVWEADNTFAYSPDGRITVTLPDKTELVWLVEIKCPPSKKDYDTTSLSPILGEHNIPGVEGKQPLTSAYYCQVQLGMQILNIQSTIFAVWTEKHTVNSKESVQVQFIERNQPFIDAMMSDAGDYFWNHYIPRLSQCACPKLFSGA